MKNIYIVEDDDNIRDMVIYALNSSGFKAYGFPDGESFWTAFNEIISQKEKTSQYENMPNLLLLDIMLPGEDGISILQKIKQYGESKDLPVIMLTAKGAEYDRIKGLDLGADDYITKPFSVLEVISRIRAVLRRCADKEKADLSLEIGGIILNPDKRNVSANGEKIELTYKEFELLMYLMMNEGIVLTRNKLLDQVWGFEYSGESRTVDMHIKSLRQKLGEYSKIIKTVRNVGYKAEV